MVADPSRRGARTPDPSEPLERLGFLTIGTFDGADPGPGHETTLAIIELGEELGLDSAWLRHRHLQYGISSLLTVLAAASQRTRRIELGTAVTPLGWENPLLFAPDIVGPSEEIARELYEHAAFREVREAVFALPFSLEPGDHVQILTDIATHLGPALGWKPHDRSAVGPAVEPVGRGRVRS